MYTFPQVIRHLKIQIVTNHNKFMYACREVIITKNVIQPRHINISNYMLTLYFFADK